MAGGISEEDIQKVREANDLVEVIGERTPVKQRGRDFWCCCPLHNEKTPSFKIDPALQLWHCFGCGEGGDVFGFIMKTEDLSFPEAVRRLAERAHIDIAESGGRKSIGSSRKARLKAVCDETSQFYHCQLMRNPGSDASAARSYLGARGLGGEVPKTWQLGFAPGHGQLVRHLSAKGFKPDEMVQANVALSNDGGKLRDRFYNRIMFPINDPQGECIAFGGRVVGKGEPKYLNSQETPLFHKSQVLYGMDKAKAAMASTGIAVVVEGYTDVIALHEAGVRNAVATLGTALTMRHIRLLSRHAQHRIVYLFDGDEAGQRAADRALAFIDDSMTPEAGKSRIELAAVTLPDNLDPADFVAQRGAEELQKLIANAQPLLKYGIERRLARHDLSRAEGRAAALADALQVLAPIKDSMLARDYAVQIATSVRAREQDVIDQLEHLKAPKAEGGARRRVRAGRFRARRRSAEAGSQPAARRDQPPPFRTSAAGRWPRAAPTGAPACRRARADAVGTSRAHAAIAQSMLDVLAEDPAASSARLVTEASRALPDAAAVLTSGTVSETAAPEQLAAFLVEELAIGDAEDAVGALRAQIADPSRLDPDELEMLYEAVAAMQQDLKRRRAAHKPLSPCS